MHTLNTVMQKENKHKKYTLSKHSKLKYRIMNLNNVASLYFT
jgi:hypothetical protein